MRRQTSAVLLTLVVAAAPSFAGAQTIRVHPTGVNVNTQGATTVFLTFGGLTTHVPAEALWCGELIPAAPDIGLKCDPATIFGRLPVRFDQSRLSAGGNAFTDIMSIPPSVARRAYQAAAAGATSSFFYVRRFENTADGPDEFVIVTCRMAGGGARTPLSFVDVKIAFDVETPVMYVEPGETPPPFAAELTYTGTGRLQGRWEVVLPGEELPSERDLLTEASLPLEERGTQRRYSQIERFNVFLPPTGRYVLPGPAPADLPNIAQGAYYILLRIEATDEKEADSSLDAAGAGTGTVHAGGVAGFPMPVLRYVVGGGGSELSLTEASPALVQFQPAEAAVLPRDEPFDFTWAELQQAAYYRIEFRSEQGEPALSAIVRSGGGAYRAPPWLAGKAAGGPLQWRVTALDLAGKEIRETGWRRFRIGEPPADALTPAPEERQ